MYQVLLFKSRRHLCKGSIDFEPCSKVHNFVFVHPKSMKLGNMANLNVIFCVVYVSLSISQNLKLAPVPS